MSLTIDKNSVLPVTWLALEYIQNQIPDKIQYGKETKLTVSGLVITSDKTIAKFVAKLKPEVGLYGHDELSATEIDHWMDFATLRLVCPSEQETAMDYLEKVLAPSTYLVGEDITLADLSVWNALRSCTQRMANEKYVNVKRYYKHLSAQPQFKAVAGSLPKAAAVAAPAGGAVKSKKKDEGKFVELEGAEHGKVVVRFPPEASGYLHIGHAKAALLNQYYQQTFAGKLIMRFDDTNPAKENADFEKIILEDVKLLGINYDIFSHTSNHFDKMLELCELMIKQGDAFVDDTDGEVMKQERSERKNSANRDNDVAKNMKMWAEMKAGTEFGQRCCVRAKIDMNSDNGCMRDPTMYRCKPETHPHTGDKYKVYPTYDFACPIVDSLEGVTHALRTTEYTDRDDQYYWFIGKLGLRKPVIWAYSRLNLQHTVLSKRKLTWFVNEGYVTGWDDPRFPTVRGVLRRGMTVEGLKQFIIAQGGSRSVVTMEWDKIWAFNKKVIDPIAPRYFALLRKEVVPVIVEDAKEDHQLHPKHPKNADIGQKTVYYSGKVFIEGADAETLKEGEVVTFINWGNLIIKSVKRDKSGNVEQIAAKLNLDNKDFKNTVKITWLADHSDAEHINVQCVHYGDLLTKPVLAPDDDFKDYINRDSKTVYNMLGDPGLAELKKGDIIQLQRRGYYICDRPAGSLSVHTGTRSPCILINIPDGHQKEMPTSGSKHKQTGSVNAKETTSGKKDKKGSKSAADQQSSTRSALDIHKLIVEQGNSVRELKSKKASKDEIDAAVKALLQLKADYKSATGTDWKPGTVPPATTVQTPAAAVTGGKSAADLHEKIVKQGDIVRSLKSKKAGKYEIDAAVKVLLQLKADYKSATGTDWKPGTVPPATTVQTPAAAVTGGKSAADLHEKIVKQGDIVRSLKSKKAGKDEIDAAVKALLQLKADYKSATGTDWKPGTVPPTTTVQTPAASQGSAAPEGGKSAAEVHGQIVKQGDLVRDLKSKKASKVEIDKEVSVLLSLKATYKTLTGMDYKPGSQPPETATQNGSAGQEELNSKITAQGNKVRQLKSDKAAKADIDEAVKVLLDLKAQYKTLAGNDWKPAGGDSGGQRGSSNNKKEKKASKKTEPKPEVKENQTAGGREVKKITLLGMGAKKEEDLSDWYSQVITKSEMIEYYDISGCYILRPWSYSIWDKIKDFFDAEIKKLGVENCYFPIFVSHAALEKEKTHIEDFAPEVAWVTKSGSSDLAEPIAIRPTSETVMYPAYAKWIQSHRDLPIRLNQWNNVVRWEFKHPQPFLRTREFLWQEGHTAFANLHDAQTEVRQILELYADVYEKFLAVPVVRGRKTEKEKFAGGDYTTTVEAYIAASGRAIQAATSHHLGQNFSKMFNIVFEDPETQKPEHVWQNSWGITTRTIGVMVMVHGDNKGLVLPPRVACHQVVVVPCGLTANMTDEDRQAVLDSCDDMKMALEGVGIRVKADLRDNYSPGWKFNHWELKGVPLRIELGPRDVKQKQFVMVRRDTGEKINGERSKAAALCKETLDKIQENMYSKAKSEMDSHIVKAHVWDELCAGLDKSCLLLSPFCGEPSCEDLIKKDSARDVVVEEGAPAMGAKGLCIPFEQPNAISADMKCIYPSCTWKPKYYTLFGRSY